MLLFYVSWNDCNWHLVIVPSQLVNELKWKLKAGILLVFCPCENK